VPGPGAGEAADAALREALTAHFKPEFVNRLDDIVRFAPLTREQIGEIVELQVGLVAARTAERGVALTLTDAAEELLGDTGYDPAYGARPLKRVIQKQLTDRLAQSLLDGSVKAGETVEVDAAEGRLTFAARRTAA
jgi:ATP-dependent Clp protease ATP-binding subunit ClpB